MNHIKLMVIGVLLLVIIVFGFIFWDDLRFNQQEISNMPVPPSPVLDQSNSSGTADQRAQEQSQNTSGMSSADNYSSLEQDLAGTSLDVDSDSTDLQTELQGL